MKALTAILLIASVCMAQNGLDTRRYDEIFASIQGERQGVSKEDIDKAQSPFKMPSIEQNTTIDSDEGGPKPVVLVLNGIVQNRAKINGSWYTVGGEISDYKIVGISNAGVTLFRSKDKQQIKLTNGSKNVNIQIR